MRSGRAELREGGCRVVRRRRCGLDVRRGQVVGVAGLTGSGREEVAGLLAGRLARGGRSPSAGALCDRRPRAAITAGMCYVPADRAQALLPPADVRENLTLADLTPFWRGPAAPRGRAPWRPKWVAELGIRPAQPDKPVAQLSGGNQQKVVHGPLATVAPRRAGARRADAGRRRRLQGGHPPAGRPGRRRGAAVIVCSTDAEELARLSTAGDRAAPRRAVVAPRRATGSPPSASSRAIARRRSTAAPTPER